MTVLKPKNIYYMLSYAYNVLREGAFINVDSEEFENIHNLFAEIIYLGISHQIKRGLIREYEEVTDQIGTVRGKIQIQNSFMGITGHSNTLTCTFDEYSLNSPMNQVLKTTMNLLLHCEEVTPAKKNQLKSLMKYFSEVDLVNPSTIQWDAFQYHRNNATYKMLMHLCYLIIKGMLLTESSGEYKLTEFLNDEEMNRLYERFIFEYFKKHHPEFSVTRKIISWNIEESNSSMLSLLPDMRTDITLQYKEKTLVIDAKYYTHILSSSQYSDVGKFSSANLYQIFTYVKNLDKDRTGNVEGMLLYAMTEEEIPEDTWAMMDGNKISVETLNLAGDWKEIVDKLEKIVADFVTE